MQQPKAKPKAAKGGKKNRKLGRHKKHCQAYRSSGLREQHKLKRVLKSSGLTAARVYAAKHNLQKYLATLS